jgi:opacity protein-like surface antigen
MKRVLLLAVVAVFCLAATSFAAGQKYIGVKTGMMMLDVSRVNDIIPIGVFGGYEFMPRMSIEGEFNYRISGGDVDYLSEFGGSKFEYKLWTLGAYFVYRYPIKPEIYLKGKAGFVHSHATAKATFGAYTFDASGSDNNLSLGVGAGYMFSGTLGLEGEYTMMSSDVNYLSIGLMKRF